ncbi:response regulator transcription factor [Aedoeadaptatus pacaensis]|uniref:response regulator transcription factor n=1 Tax=Aedoeadaptatus pacaensis TaxID=1776390 RepID=UPI0008393119|nr:response regulator transcription factor [Peptoniphilus pacaensis]
MKEKILIVDDEKEICDLLAIYLHNDGYVVETAYDGEEALEKIKADPPDAMILDIMLAGMDGFSLCKRIRENYFFPILMLTSKIDFEDKILGLTIGADDYMTKPFNPLEVVARIKTQLRRSGQYNQGSGGAEDEISVRGLVINKREHKCILNESPLSLTPIEFEIVWYLCEHLGDVVSSEALFEAIWREKYMDNNNTVMAHIGRIREKMNDSGRHSKYIKTVWGVGYVIEK